MVLLGITFKCVDPILILAAIESNRSFFLTPPGAIEENHRTRQAMSLGQPSDHLALLNAFREWRFIKGSRGRAAANEYAHAHLMHVGALQTIEKTAEQMLAMVVEWKLAKNTPTEQRYNCELGDPELNVNSDVQPLVFSLLTAGLVPNLAVQMTPILLQTSTDAKAMIHPSSLNSGGSGERSKKDRYLGAGPPGTLVLFSSKHLTGGGVFLRDTSIIGPMTGLMFGKVTISPEENNIIHVDDWLPMKFEPGVARNVLQVTQCLDNVQSPFYLLTLVFESNLVPS
jgi:ATP-dependent RNA helicase DHX36